MAKHRHGRRRAGKSSPDPLALRRSVQDASYPVTWQVTSSQTALGSAWRHDQHRRAAEAFAQRYFAEHGHLPTGTHHVVIAAKPGHAPAFEADITYPR
jgi:hypothetical protein